MNITLKYTLSVFFVIVQLYLIQAQELNIIGGQVMGDIHRLKGKVVDADDKSLLVGVNIQIEGTDIGFVTDENGRFIIDDLKFNKVYNLIFSYIGYEKQVVSVLIKGNGNIRVDLKSKYTELGEIVITGEVSDLAVKSTNIGKNSMTVESIKTLPRLGGEVDILKSITLLPGVSSVGEASSGVNVRGGGTDQNLVLLNTIPIYNPTHMFGFFSGISSEFIDDVSLYKGMIPSQYGGRSSSVLQMNVKSGDFYNWKGAVTLGIISSNASLEGPIIKDKLSISLGGRASYINWLLSSNDNVSLKNSSARFNDVNANVEWRVNEKNIIDYTVYRSFDNFQLASDTANQWVNFGQELGHRFFITEKLTSELYLAESRYSFALINQSGRDDFKLDSDLRDLTGKFILTYGFSEENVMSIGAQSNYRTINPGKLTPLSDSEVIETEIDQERALETGIFFNHKVEISKWLGIEYGLRYNLYQYLGPQSVDEYREFFPRSESTVVNTEEYGDNQSIFDFTDFTPRVGLRLSLNESTSIKAGFNVMNQFIQIISNSATVSPVNIWKLSDQYLPPQKSFQYSVGIFKNFNNNTIETSIEGYYKTIDNVIEYKDGAVLLLNDNIERELVSAQGEAYGVEFFVKKKSGQWNGWASYTYSRSFRKVESAYPENQINNGKWYPSNFDKPHDLTFVVNYDANTLFTFSTIFTYSTGRPVTLPQGKFSYFQTVLPYFDSRNESRIPDYHRLDLSVNLNSRSKYRLLNGVWNFTLYNVYGRNNAYSVFFQDQVGAPPGPYQLSVLDSVFPSLSYTYKIN